MSIDETEPSLGIALSPTDYATHKLVDVTSDSHLNTRLLSFQFMHDGFSIVDVNGIHVDVNPAFCRMTGFSEQELIGSAPKDLYWPPEDFEQIRRAFARTLSGEFGEVELFFQRKCGQRFPVLVNPFAIRDQAGTVLYFAATVKDITQRVAMEAALQEKEERYRALFENAGDAIVIMKGEQIVDCNERALSLTGRTREELLNISTVDFFPPTQPNGEESREFFAQKAKTSLVDGPQHFEWTGLIAGGIPIVSDVTLSALKMGDSYYLQSIMRDITHRKQLEEALGQSEQRYRSLFENAGDGILIMQGDTVLDCNQRVLDIYGISREDLMTKSDYSLSPPLQPNGQPSQDLFAEKIRALDAENPQTFQWLGRKLDGTPIQTEVTLTKFMLDGKALTQSLIRDVTRRRQLEIALRESEVRYRTLFESAGDAIAIHKGNRTIDCNQRMCDLYGLTREEILSATTGDYFPPTQPNGQDSREYFREKFWAARAGVTQVYEWHGRRRDGKSVVTEISLTSFTIGTDIYEQAIARDITQRKQMEEALRDLNRNLEDRVAQRTTELERVCAELLQRNAQFRELASRLTHAENEERRRIAQVLHDNHQQLIVAAKFRIELLQAESSSSKMHEVGQQVLEILDQALEVSRSLTMELAPPILYGAGLVVALQWLARWMEDKYSLEVVLSGSLPMTRVPTDVSTLLFQAVRELLLNVIKHSGVRIAAVRVALENDEIQVAVQDEGAGFDVGPELESPRSFGLFHIQERLGLLGGRLQIVSEPGGGTLSLIAVPLPLVDVSTQIVAQSPLPDERAWDAPTARSRTIRILVTDDHAPARASLVQVLSQVDEFDVVGEAEDGLDALEQVRLLRPDVVLMDVNMPRLNGFESARRLTREFPGVKVIGVSVLGSEIIQAYMLSAGAECHVQKGAPAQELIAAIHAAARVSVPADSDTADD